jgi:hypothetical protein
MGPRSNDKKLSRRYNIVPRTKDHQYEENPTPDSHRDSSLIIQHMINGTTMTNVNLD